MRITRARRDCCDPFHKRRLWSCWPTARSESCARGPRQPRSFPLYTSSPRRRLERRASKCGHEHFTKGIRRSADWGQLRQGANIRQANARFGADCRLASFQYIRPTRRWLFDCLNGDGRLRRLGHHASRSGGWRLNTHLSRYLIAMLWGLDPTPPQPSIINRSLRCSAQTPVSAMQFTSAHTVYQWAQQNDCDISVTHMSSGSKRTSTL